MQNALNAFMRTHTDIIKARGATKLFSDLEAQGLDITAPGVQAWANRNSIPPAYWPHIVALGLATLEELSLAAAVSAGIDLPKDATAILNDPDTGSGNITTTENLPEGVMPASSSDIAPQYTGNDAVNSGEAVAG